jgi:hypothetical protein
MICDMAGFTEGFREEGSRVAVVLDDEYPHGTPIAQNPRNGIRDAGGTPSLPAKEAASRPSSMMSIRMASL